MKKLAFLLSITSFFAKAQSSLEWAVGIGTATNNLVVERSIAHDHAGNILITGEYDWTVDFDPGPGVVNLPFMGDRDVFISKFDAAGHLLWTKGIGGAGYDYVTSIESDGSGNIYVIGHFQGTVDFDPGPGTANLTATTNIDMYILKLDGSGNFIWAKDFGGPSGVLNGNALAADPLGNVYATGLYTGTVDFNPGSGTYLLTSPASLGNQFILKLNPSGNFSWAKSMYATKRSAGNAIKTDVSGNVYTTGHYLDTVDFDPGPGTFTLSSVINSGNAASVLKLDSSGHFKWARGFSGNGNTLFNSLAIDPDGNIYSAGSFNYTTDFDPGTGVYNLNCTGNSNAVILKLDSLGSFVWAKDFKVPTGAFSCDIHSVALDALNYVYAIGRFTGTVDFDPAATVFNITGGNDAFISKLDLDGNFSWAGNFAAPGSNNIANHYKCDLTIDPSNAIYAAGNYWGTQDFDPGSGTYTLTTANNFATFLSKFKAGIVGIEDLSNEEAALSVYPNPNTGVFNVQLDPKIENAELLIFNAFGQEIKRQSLQSGSNNIVMKACAGGLYYYSVVQNNKVVRSGKISVN